ncbi:hypothetical protein FCV25MIE_04951 [Fagus crenata]
MPPTSLPPRDHPLRDRSFICFFRIDFVHSSIFTLLPLCLHLHTVPPRLLGCPSATKSPAPEPRSII